MLFINNIYLIFNVAETPKRKTVLSVKEKHLIATPKRARKNFTLAKTKIIMQNM